MRRRSFLTVTRRHLRSTLGKQCAQLTQLATQHTSMHSSHPVCIQPSLHTVLSEAFCKINGLLCPVSTGRIADCAQQGPSQRRSCSYESHWPFIVCLLFHPCVLCLLCALCSAAIGATPTRPRSIGTIRQCWWPGLGQCVAR